MISTKWKDYQVLDLDGITSALGEVHEVSASGINPVNRKAEVDDWLYVDVLAEAEIFGGKYRVKCGESSAHGSIGVVVLEDAKTHELLWSFVSSWSNPFDQIAVKGGQVIVLSTSASVFRFRPELEDVALFISS